MPATPASNNTRHLLNTLPTRWSYQNLNNAILSEMLQRSHTPIFMELGQFFGPIHRPKPPNEAYPLSAEWVLFCSIAASLASLAPLR